MTALADISKAAAAMHGDHLRGSDLTQFNEEHKRDSKGRFAAMAAAPSQVDPRVARKARVQRRRRRAAKAGQARALSAVASSEKAEEAQSDPRSLQALHRPRIQTRALAQIRTRMQTRSESAPQKAKASLNDKEYLKQPLGDIQAHNQWIIVTEDEAREFAESGSLVVGAANERWGTTLEANDLAHVAEHVKARMGSFEGSVVPGLIAMSITNDSIYADEETINGRGYLRVSDAQVLTPYFGALAEGARSAEKRFDLVLGNPLRLDEMTTIRALPVNVHTAGDYKTVLRGRDVDILKADETWEEKEHKRDPRSGRFMALAAPTVLETDPRIARAQRTQRRKRRAARATTAHAVAAPAEAQARPAEMRERLLERRGRTRADPRSRTRSGSRPLSLVEQQVVEEPPTPKRTPGRLVYGGEGAGGRIVSAEEYDAIQRAASRERVSRYTPSRQLTVRPKETVVPDVRRLDVNMKESSRLGAAPRFLWDEESGELLNLAEIRAYNAGKRARTRKPSS